MAFAYTIKKTSVFGDVRVEMGTYTNGAGDSGGTIKTGLKEVYYFNSDCETSNAGASNKVAISGGEVTITTANNEDGKWLAIGV